MLLKAVRDKRQKILFCRVNYHLHNDKSEKRIRGIKYQKRKQMNHTKSRWPIAVKISIWTYAIKQANNIHN